MGKRGWDARPPWLCLHHTFPTPHPHLPSHLFCDVLAKVLAQRAHGQQLDQAEPTPAHRCGKQ
eukprot:253358-Chlamydomonas_euryale.AAC.1